MPLDAGSRLGPYEVLAPLAPGGMGEVYRARDARLGREVAVKIITSDGTPSADRLRRFEDEARAAGALNHPNILSVFDVGSDGGLPYVVFELLEGETLRDRLLRGPLPARSAVEYAVQACHGLAASHDKGILHRDLKPENLFLTSDGRVKILDFGLAKLSQGLDQVSKGSDDKTRTLTQPGLVLGTLGYMSPEQVRGLPAGPRSDIFSLGVVLHEMLSGRPAFRRDSAADTVAAILHEDPPELSSGNRTISPMLADVVRRCLKKEPVERFQSARDLAFALTQVLSGGEQERPVARSLPQVGRTPRMILGRRVGAVIAVLLLAAALGISYFRWGRTPARPLAVLVQEPRLASSQQDELTRSAAFALREAVLRTLVGLQGIEPIGPDELPEGPLTVQAAARAVAADEVVIPTIACTARWCQVSLRREHGDDGHIIRNTGSFDVSSEPEESVAFANAVAIHLREAFSDHPSRSPSEHLEARSADYQKYLLLRRRTEAGEVLGRSEVAELEQITHSSPGLVEAYLLAAGIARGLPDRTRALTILQDAEAHHHDDPRALYERFLLELDTGKIPDAEAALAELEKRAPGDPRVWRARARLLGRQGKLKEAAEVRRQMVRERPSWRNLWYVADTEIALGEAQGARQHLDQLLEVSPGNARGRAKRAELEWLLGDPAEAARIYEGLLKEKITWENLSNLGWSLLLAGEYSAAAGALRRTLELEPDDLLTRLNLGIADEGLGDAEGARTLYRDLLDRIALRERKGSLSLYDRLIKAQAQARLGDTVPAVALTVQALAEGNSEVQVVFQAAIIYALCGEQNNAILRAREARQRGLSARWFGIPGFESLRSKPAFRELLAPV